MIFFLALAFATTLARAGDHPDVIVRIITVNQHPVIQPIPDIDTDDSEQGLVWQLEGPYQFADNGIVIPESHGAHECHKGAGGRRFRCDKRGPQQPRYKYNVNVNGVDPLDPVILNH